MDPSLIYTSFCAVVVLLPGTTGLSNGADCRCPKIPQKNFTSPANGCFGNNSGYRYQCIQGYKRKSGTSSFIKCLEESGALNWTISLFECIPDPDYHPQPTTSMGTSTSHQTSTFEAAKSPNTEQTTLGGDPTRISILLFVVMLVGGVIFLLYRRRNKAIPSRTTEELKPMKC